MLTPLIRKKSICIFAAQIIQMNHSFPDNAINLPFFFIIGRPRSGTTMLRTLFDAHPNVTIPLECPLIKHLSDKYRHIKLWDERLLHMLYQDVLKQQKFDTWFINVNELKESLLKYTGHYTFQDIVKVIYAHYHSFYDKEEIQILGDKNPSYSICPEKIFRLFPDAKYIYLTRDYRDNILSILKVDFEAPNIPLIAYRWRYSAKKVLHLVKQHPASFYIIPYEKLVAEPELYLQEMCTFIGVDYRPEMLEFYKKKDEVMKIVSEESFNKYHSSLFHPVTADKIYSWKKKMSRFSVQCADLVVGKYAELQGYDRAYHHFGVLIYLAVLPGVLYGKFSFFITRYIDLLPFNLRMMVRNKGSLLAKTYWFFANLFRKRK